MTQQKKGPLFSIRVGLGDSELLTLWGGRFSSRFGRLILLLGVLLSVGASAAAPPKGKGAGAAPGASRDIAVEAMRGERRVALIIGNGAYRTSSLRNPVHDARAMAQALRGLGFEVLAYENLSQKEINRAIVAFGDRLTGSGVGLFYFAGHGVQVSGRNYMIPTDAEIRSEKDVEVESVDVAGMLVQMESARNRLNIVILDACRDNPFGRSFRSSARGLASIDAPTGTIIVYVTAPGKTAHDGEGSNGLYTGELLKAMRAPGLKIEEVFKRVRQAVRSQTRGEQVPWESSSLVGDFMFVLPATVAEAPSIPPPPPKVAIREEVLSQFGSLAIRAKESGVEVWLDDRRIGETKAGRLLVAEKLPVGTHRVKGSKTGYREWEREVKVAADARAEVAIDLEPLRTEVPEVGVQIEPSQTESLTAIQGQDGAEMMLVPAGEFLMGSPQGEGNDDERPQHRVYLDAFYIDKYEVTNTRYRRCMEAGGCTPPHKRDWSDDPQRANHPVVRVDWEQAWAYCSWAGKRLPTEAEWEKAARGPSTDSGDGRVYPWGNDFGSGHANILGKEDGYGGTAPVGSFPSGASSYGLLDMAGNVWEWVADWYDENYYARSPSRNPKGPDSGSQRLLRGGSWNHVQFRARAAYRGRYVPGYWPSDYGFRCAQDFR